MEATWQQQLRTPQGCGRATPGGFGAGELLWGWRQSQSRHIFFVTVYSFDPKLWTVDDLHGKLWTFALHRRCMDAGGNPEVNTLSINFRFGGRRGSVAGEGGGVAGEGGGDALGSLVVF